MSWPEVYVLRHGETEWNREGRMQGALHSCLTDTGRAQAQQQAEVLQRLDLTGFQFLCSPQGRAVQTAGIALKRVAAQVHTDDRLREIGVGDWAGLLRKDIADDPNLKEGPDGAIDLYKNAPGGEGFDALHARMKGFLADLDRPSVLVTHGIASRMLRTILLGRSVAQMDALPGGQGNVFHLKDGVQKELV